MSFEYLSAVKIATWNVNSLRAREELVIDWLRREEPDVLCLQETKVTDEDFPTEAFQRLGYAVMMTGEKSYNGVAIASRKLMRNVRFELVGAKPNDDKRVLAATVGKIDIVCCYVPNGKSVESPSFTHKLGWLDQLIVSLEDWTEPARDVFVCGDFNIATDQRDAHDIEALRGHTHFHPEEHKRLAKLKAWGLSDAFRLREERGELYSWWDYRGGAFRKNEGLRIDYAFISESLAKRCANVHMDKAERAKERPSDHIPVVVEFADVDPSPVG